jgi:purine-nucleoside phosphorylase
MTEHYLIAEEAANYIQNRIGKGFKTGMILGTGLQNIIKNAKVIDQIPYEDIPGFVKSTVESHQGTLYALEMGHQKVLCFSGRFHYYEGYPMKKVVLPVHTMKILGIQNLILTNASGAVNPHYNEADIVLVNDHISLFPEHPLRGPNDDEFGVRFPDMSTPYDPEWIDLIKACAERIGIKIQEGIYLGWQGPSLETPAEYRMVRLLGADVVGMSSVPEVIAARHAGMRVAMLSVVSNVCFPKERLRNISLEDVLASVKKAEDKLEQLLVELFKNDSFGLQAK